MILHILDSPHKLSFLCTFLNFSNFHFRSMEAILAEAKNNNGTWAYKTVVEIQQLVKKMKDKEYHKFLSGLIEALTFSENTPLTTFKIAQLITNIQSQNLGRSQECFNAQRHKLLEMVENLPFSNFSIPIKRSVNAWFDPEAFRRSSLQYRKNCELVVVQSCRPASAPYLVA